MLSIGMGCTGGSREACADGGVITFPGEHVLQNVRACDATARTEWGPDGLTVVARLVPPSWPFRVDSVRYTVGGDPEDCDPSLPQTVRVFASREERPPAAPDEVEVIEVTGGEERSPPHALAAPPVRVWGKAVDTDRLAERLRELGVDPGELRAPDPPPPKPVCVFAQTI
ncbi:MAG: hypothetical protein ACFCGT_05820 [Sandaracinaceae bacterium]